MEGRSATAVMDLPRSGALSLLLSPGGPLKSEQAAATLGLLEFEETAELPMPRSAKPGGSSRITFFAHDIGCLLATHSRCAILRICTFHIRQFHSNRCLLLGGQVAPVDVRAGGARCSLTPESADFLQNWPFDEFTSMARPALRHDLAVVPVLPVVPIVRAATVDSADIDLTELRISLQPPHCGLRILEHHEIGAAAVWEFNRAV